jgi:hypothetical protein
MYREADHTQLAEGVKGLIEANTSTVHLIDWLTPSNRSHRNIKLSMAFS